MRFGKFIYSLSAIFIFSLFYVPASAQKLIAHKKVLSNAYDFWVCLPRSCRPDTITIVNPYRKKGFRAFANTENGKQPFSPVGDTTLVYDRKFPLLVFLHGSSLSGTDLSQVRRYGPLDAVARGKDIPAIILAPQSRKGRGGWKPDKVLKLIEWVEAHHPVDGNRIYVMGMSMGGFGTINFTGTYPGKVAAGIALCGGGSLNDYAGLNEVPFWIAHGKSDRVVPWRYSKYVVDAMKKSGDTDLLQADFLPGVNHSKLARCFYMQKTYDWLFSHSLSDSLRTGVSVEYTVEDLRNAYREFAEVPRRRLEVFEYREGRLESLKTTETMDPADMRYHKIRQGDTLSGLALRYGTSVKRLCSMNGISPASVLRIGKSIRVE